MSKNEHRVNGALLNEPAFLDKQLELLILADRSWVIRRVEEQKYAGGATWQKSISFDIDYDYLRKMTSHFIESSEKGDSASFQNELYLPLIYADKRQLFSDFVLHNESRKWIELVSREEAVEKVALAALDAAMCFEDAEKKSQYESCRDIVEKAFSSQLSPVRNVIRREKLDPISSKEIVQKIRDAIIEGYNVEDEEKSAFKALMERCEPFKYFVKLFSQKWPVCIKVKLDELMKTGSTLPHIVEIGHSYVRNLMNGSESSSFFNPVSSFNFELEGFRDARSCHYSIEAPPGTLFCPSELQRANDSKKNAGRKSKETVVALRERCAFFIRQMIESAPSDEGGRVLGVLTDSEARLKVLNERLIERAKAEDIKEQCSALWNDERRYVMNLKICPKLTFRIGAELGFCVLSCLMWVLVFASLLNRIPFSEDSVNISDAGAWLTALAAIVPMIMEKKGTFIARWLNHMPRTLFLCCVGLSVFPLMGWAFVSISAGRFPFVMADYHGLCCFIISVALVDGLCSLCIFSRIVRIQKNAHWGSHELSFDALEVPVISKSDPRKARSKRSRGRLKKHRQLVPTSVIVFTTIVLTVVAYWVHPEFVVGFGFGPNPKMLCVLVILIIVFFVFELLVYYGFFERFKKKEESA